MERDSETRSTHDEIDVTDPFAVVLVDRGASIVEYALLVALIAVVCIGAVAFFGTSTTGSLSTSGGSLFAG